MVLDSSTIFSIGIGSVVLALSYSACYQGLRMEKRPAAVIAFAFAVITYLFLMENPDVLEDATTKIALALIGAVVMLALWIRRRVP
jgi:hypothetical protein